MRGGREDTKKMAGRAPLAMQFRGSGDGHSGDDAAALPCLTRFGRRLGRRAEYRGRIRVR